MPPERVRMPMAPTFCLRSVFCTPATMAPTAVVCSAVLAVFERASRGWKVACWAAMAGGMGGGVDEEPLQSSVDSGDGRDGLARRRR